MKGRTRTEGGSGLPKLFEGDRRKILGLLIGTGLLLAVLAGATALLMTALLGSGADTSGAVLAGAGLLAAALGIGGLRSLERVLAERLGQSYIQQIRLGLVDAAMTAEKPPAAGITIARATNDLTSVRNWVSLGIAPLAVGIPLILGATVGLALLHPALGLAALIPLLVLATAMIALARRAFERAKTVRRKRGRLASLLADTVAATPVIRAASGEKREVRRIGVAGQAVVDAAVARSRITGYIRGAAAGAAAVAVAAVGVVGLWQSMETAVIAGALTIVGLISTPVSDLGRVVEYRQNFKAARRILAPALQQRNQRDEENGQGNNRGQPANKVQPAVGAVLTRSRTGSSPVSARTSRQLPRSVRRGDGVVSIVTPSECGSCAPPAVLAGPGDTVIVDSSDPARVDAVFDTVLGFKYDPEAIACVDGVNLLDAAADRRRELVGYASAGASLERGTIARAIRYRRPDLGEDEGWGALERVGLTATVRSLSKGERTQLRRGGEPLTVSERARLLLGRAALADPPLLILNRIDTELDDDGVVVLHELVEGYPGVVMMAGGSKAVTSPVTNRRTVTWSVGCAHAASTQQEDRGRSLAR